MKFGFLLSLSLSYMKCESMLSIECDEEYCYVSAGYTYFIVLLY